MLAENVRPRNKLMNNRLLVQGALLIATAAVLQSLRLILPLPPVLSTFIIGSLVNMMLVITGRMAGMAAACVLTFLLPVLAYMQGQLALPFLIPVVIAGNLLYVWLTRRSTGKFVDYLLAPLGKTAVMIGAAKLVLVFLQVPAGPLTKNILFAMSVPQFITGIAGIVLAKKIMNKLKKVY